MTFAHGPWGNQEIPALTRVRASVEQLSGRDVRMEVCAVATDQFGVDNDTILPRLHVVQDGFVSAIGRQGQGYGLVPIF